MAEPRRALLVRLPTSLFERLQAAARADRRSLNGAVQVAVERYILDLERTLPQLSSGNSPSLPD